VERDADFFDLGIKSLAAVTMLQKMNESFHLELTPEIFGQRTIAATAVYISQLLKAGGGALPDSADSDVEVFEID
jgi:hypothetical protein